MADGADCLSLALTGERFEMQKVPEDAMLRHWVVEKDSFARLWLPEERRFIQLWVTRTFKFK